MTSTRFEALDGWRGICACLIVFHHFAPAAGVIGSLPIIINGFLFVDFFFVLSGFIAVHAYRTRLRSTANLAPFIWARFARLWPLHALLLALIAAIEVARSAIGSSMGQVAPAFTGHFPLSTLPTQILFLESLGIHSELTWNAPSWSSAAEFLTAIAFGLICVGLPARYIGSAAAAVSACALLLIAVFSPRYMNATYSLGFVRCCADFFCGAFCCHQWHRLPAGTSGSGRLWATPQEAAVIAVVVAFVAGSGETRASLLAPLVFGMAVIVFAAERGQISTILRHRGLQSLGLWSYAIYMLQVPLEMIVHFALRSLEKMTGPSGWSGALTLHSAPESLKSTGIPPGLSDLPVLLFLALLVLTARFTYRYVEYPCQIALRKVFPEESA